MMSIVANAPSIWEVGGVLHHDLFSITQLHGLRPLLDSCEWGTCLWDTRKLERKVRINYPASGAGKLTASLACGR
jgi:hypothetical protein